MKIAPRSDSIRRACKHFWHRPGFVCVNLPQIYHAQVTVPDKVAKVYAKTNGMLTQNNDARAAS
ncbi:MAG: hypothetical protein WBW53_20770 [Terriglobales bacterium]